MFSYYSTSPASSVKKTISISKSGTDPEELDRCKTVLDALGPAIHTKATSGKKQELNRNSLEEYLSLSSTKAILRNSLFRDRDKCNELLKETQKQLEGNHVFKSLNIFTLNFEISLFFPAGLYFCLTTEL